METSLLLTTKLNIPPAQANLVARPRLIERLQECLSCNFVLISAPAGFGKTTLLSEWARQNQPRIHTAWISLDEGDNDPIRFWDYFIAALKTLQPAFGESTLALLHSPQLPPVESLLTVLINELAVVSSRFVLILDDYHLITAKPVHDSLTYLLEHMPSKMRLLMATRADPPLPLAHFRGRGMMLEIRTDDLRFSRDEAIALFRGMRTPVLTDEDAGVLDSHTQGWVVGLKMAALAMREHPDVPGFLASFSGSQRYIMDYLMEEVLQRQSEDVKDFLLKTSVLERLTAPLCDSITGSSDSHDMLLKLEHDNLFIAPLDESRQWYRYEHLFRDLLSHQLEVTLGVRDIAVLHRRASHWYEQNKYPDDTIHHALAAQDWESAMRLITGASEKKRHSGEYVTLSNWLQRIPEAVIHRDLGLCIVYGSMLIATGQHDAAGAVIDFLEQAARGDSVLRGYVASLRSGIAYSRGDIKSALELGKEALSLLPPDELDVRSGVGMNLGYIYWQRGHFKEAEPLLTEAYEAGRQVGNYYNAAAALSLLGDMDVYKGKLRRAAGRHQQAIELAGASPAAAVTHQSLSALYYEWNDLEAAVHHGQRAIELGQLTGGRDFLARVNAILARCILAQNDEAGAMKALENSCLIAHNISLPSARAEHAAYHILIALGQGDLATASKWGSKMAEDAGALPFYFNHIPMLLLIAQGERTTAAEKLQALYEETIQGGAQSQIIKIRLYQALAAGTTESALRFLADVLAMVEPEGYIRSFVDEGRLLAPLLRQAISRGISPEYASKLLTIIESEEGQKQKAKGGEMLLSKRELEILRLLADGLSNQQIADKLVISYSTTKNHIHNILEKLNVQRRTQAVAQARELKLL